MRSVFVTFICFAVLGQSFVVAYRSFGQSCYPNQVDYACDPYRNLQCLAYTAQEYTCQCAYTQAGNTVYVSRYDRCTYQIGGACTSSYVSAYLQGANTPQCPPNSYCNPQTNICTCEDYHYPNYDRTECNGVSTTTATMYLIITSVLTKLFVL